MVREKCVFCDMGHSRALNPHTTWSLNRMHENIQTKMREKKIMKRRKKPCKQTKCHKLFIPDVFHSNGWIPVWFPLSLSIAVSVYISHILFCVCVCQMFAAKSMCSWNSAHKSAYDVNVNWQRKSRFRRKTAASTNRTCYKKMWNRIRAKESDFHFHYRWENTQTLVMIVCIPTVWMSQ